MDMKDNWTVIQTTKLIAAFKKFPHMWDSNNKYYRNKVLRKKCLRIIAKIVSEVKPGTTINDVRGKLKTLRSQYGKEKRLKNEFLSQGGIGEYVPKLWCYDDIKFIDMESNQNDEDETLGEDVHMKEEIIAELLDDAGSDANEERVVRRGRPSRFPSWTKEQTFSLLLLFKQHPLLYDTTHPFYANPVQRTKAFHSILAKIRPLKPKVTIPDMRAKLKTLRSQYMKEKRLLKGTTQLRGRVKYIPKLWCFEHLKFLDERGKFLEEERELSASSQEKEFEVGEQPDDCYVVENENEIYVKSFDDSDMDESPVTPPPGNGQVIRSILHQKCLTLVDSLTKQMRMEQESRYQHDADSKTPQALLGKLVEVELLKVSDEVFEEVKWKIMKLLEEASKKKKDVRSYRYTYN